MVAINWTDEAEVWLKEIHNYIAVDSKPMASKIINDIYNRTQVLITFPKIGYKYQGYEDNDIRILLYGHYRIAYVIKDSSTIDILGVFHGSLDIERYL